jgi:hypothetical protein
MRNRPYSSGADPHHVDADPNSTYHLGVDQDADPNSDFFEKVVK